MPQIVQSETVDKNISAVEQGASFGTVDLVTKLDVKKTFWPGDSRFHTLSLNSKFPEIPG